MNKVPTGVTAWTPNSQGHLATADGKAEPPTRRHPSQRPAWPSWGAAMLKSWDVRPDFPAVSPTSSQARFLSSRRPRPPARPLFSALALSWLAPALLI